MNDFNVNNEKTIAIIEFIHYDGKHTSKDHMYFETKLRAERYLKGNGYEPDDISGWKKDESNFSFVA